MKKELIKVEIEKSIGNSFVIKKDGLFYDIVTWVKASQLVNSRPTLKDTIKECPKEIEISLRKQLSDENYSELTCMSINWIDKRKSVFDIIKNGNVTGSKVQVQSYSFSNTKKKLGFKELETPKIKYYLTIDGFDLEVKKNAFLKNMINVRIVEKRSC